ncbi:cytochrome c oxidase subunit II [Bythopirellula polymerisocia]|uniref:Cytochrome c oxidase subunit 2 n=1 Tax=Bythopirellula polymerisocia TaxID=2528003 RepID=A0A5C6CT04_9BACT|nr:cytochrome c oxidase subunit II [Bythopirellula polymerisocia]TWU28073.1 Cytochrome c oxidase subunit 2 precursor [Bythopirellula polymerisocia]
MFPVFQPESPEAQAIYDLFILVLMISAAIFIIVAGLIAVALWRGRSRAILPKQDFGSEKREIYWMVGPILIVIWITAISAKLILTVNAFPKIQPPGDEMAEADLTVTGHQWWWEIEHHESGIVEANEIYIPTGKKLRVKLQSADVIHCFWVPQLARKMDVIPGRENYIWLEAGKPGVYQGRCAEYCGNQHAWMNFKVYALTTDEFAKWESGEKVAPGTPAEPAAVAGEKLFFAHTCSNCHTVAGTVAQATIGPDLTRVASRKQLAGGAIENSTENLVRWLKNPQAIKPGCKMPNFKFSDDEARQVAAYLESLN